MEVAEGVLRIEAFNPLLRTEAWRLLGRARAELGERAAAWEGAVSVRGSYQSGGFCLRSVIPRRPGVLCDGRRGTRGLGCCLGFEWPFGCLPSVAASAGEWPTGCLASAAAD